MRKIKKGDEVIIIAGKDKGRRGKIARVLLNQDRSIVERVIVEGINLIKKHVRPNPQRGTEGGIVEMEASIHASNVALYNPTKKAADRVGIKVLEDGRKVRYFKSNGEIIDL